MVNRSHKQKLAGSLSHFRPIRALVVGDFLLDTYTTGRVKRISPEAPVPVLEVEKQEMLPGGAGNVVLSMIALGAEVYAVGRIGEDAQGEQLRECLRQAGARLEVLCKEKGYRTPVKNRLIGDSQQLLRVDFETITSIPPTLEECILEQLIELLPQMQVVALSDYGKGFLTSSLISKIIQMAKQARVPVVVDPKGLDFTKYRGATVLKPNRQEAYAAAGFPSTTPLDQVAKRLIELSQVEMLLITRSEAGMSLYNALLARQDFPVRTREVKDVTGAGDSVLAVISVGLANGLEISIAAELANIAAGIAIERLGCVQVSLSQLAKRLLEVDCESKVFDDSQTFALRQVLKNKTYSLLALPQGQKMSNGLFRGLKRLKKDSDEELIVFVRGKDQEDEFIQFLSSLQEVDYIIVHAKSLKTLCEEMHPRAIYLLEDERLKHVEGPQTILEHLLLMTK